jgi:hypothetical protein
MKRLSDTLLRILTLVTVACGSLVLYGALSSNGFARQDATMTPLEIVAHR